MTAFTSIAPRSAVSSVDAPALPSEFVTTARGDLFDLPRMRRRPHPPEVASSTACAWCGRPATEIPQVPAPFTAALAGATRRTCSSACAAALVDLRVFLPADMPPLPPVPTAPVTPADRDAWLEAATVHLACACGPSAFAAAATDPLLAATFRDQAAWLLEQMLAPRTSADALPDGGIDSATGAPLDPSVDESYAQGYAAWVATLVAEGQEVTCPA